MIPSSNLQAPVVSAPVLQLQQARRIPGFVYGLRAPCVAARISVEDPVQGRAIALCARQALSSHIPVDVPTNVDSARKDDAAVVVACLAQLIQSVQEAAGLPQAGAAHIALLTSARADAQKPPAARQWLLALPALVAAPALLALRWTVQYLNEAAASGEADLSAEQQARLQRLLKEMHRHAPPGSNNLFFIQAAYRLGIPCVPLPGMIFQYGWGRRAQWLDSSFTQNSSNISTRLARSKSATHRLLLQAGLPVPAQRSVRTIDEAVSAAEALGYPVVVKPADRDGGVGVSAGIATQSELRTAFKRASDCSPNVLVEKHIAGCDYRVYVFRGRMFAAMTREPASVTGDGTSTVAALVAEVNRDPRRGHYPSAPLTRIELDDEALELLEAQSLRSDSVLAQGRRAVLRRSANVSTGGMPTAICDRVHPDNARLCERAAQILRLDLAGIDLLMPDITRSWLEVGGGICEVNAQPQISSVALRDKFGLVMSELIEKQGRIPAALVLTPDAGVVEAAAKLLAERNVRVGSRSSAGVRIGAQCIRTARGSALADTHALLIDPTVEAIIVAVDSAELLAHGVPFDRFDVLVIAGSVEADARLRTALSLLRPHCRREVLTVPDASAAAVASEVFQAARIRSMKAEQLSAALAHALSA